MFQEYRLALKHIRYCFRIQTHGKRIILKETAQCAPYRTCNSVLPVGLEFNVSILILCPM